MPDVTHQAGFTLTELLVTVAVVGGLSLMAISFGGTPNFSREARDTMVDAVSQAHRMRSAATSFDAQNAGYPPDVRGRIRIEVRYCGSNPPDGITCNDQWTPYFAVITELLKPGGNPAFERWREGYLQMSPIECEGEGCRDGLAQLYARKSFDITRGVTCQGPPDDNPMYCDTAFTQAEGFSKLMWMGGPAEAMEIWCYHNGTCDPVTYYFHNIGGRPELHRIAVSMTGSIHVSDNWGN
ncbi:MAG: type II secretion system protein [Myxococcales bacterium]|nr:type II secretion system protein [Myxococcales bacterium]